MTQRLLFTLIATLMVPLSGFSQRQQHFRKELPAGNYSGICSLGNDLYAVVSDKSETDGFFIFRIVIDSIRRQISQVENMGYRSSGQPNRDMEGICFRPSTQTLFIAGEADNEVYEYTLDGQRTGRCLQMPEVIRQADSNYGLESITYHAGKRLFYTTTEHTLPGDSLLRIFVFNDDLTLQRQYLYRPDLPLSAKHIYGVSELCALTDGRLLVLERQIRVPRLKIGASVLTRIYEVHPGADEQLEKRLVTEFKTRLTVTSRKFANFEGLCQTPQGHLLLIADSQNQYKGVLRDWLMTTPAVPAE